MSTDGLDLTAIDKHVQEYAKQKRGGWLRRNWKWFVPLDLLVTLLVVAGVLYWVFYTRVYRLNVCQDAMCSIATDPDVQKALGDPIDPAAWPSRESVPSARIDDSEIDIRWEIKGPKGSAKAHALSKKRQGKWETVVLEVTLPDGKKKPIHAPGGDDAPAFNPGGQGASPAAKKPKTKNSDLDINMPVPPADGPPAAK
jgi:hypothetical protein